MKLPEPPPDWTKQLSAEKIISFLSPSDEVKTFLQKANSEYWYWEKFKQIRPPDGLTEIEAWAALKIARSLNKRTVPLKAKDGQLFSFSVTPTMQGLLSKIDQYFGGNISLGEDDSLGINQERYVINSLMEEAIASSQIEGAATTRKKAKAMLRSGKKPQNKDQQMILNNYLTILRVRREWKNKELSKELINEIHKSMSHETLDHEEEEGCYRTDADDIHIIDEEQKILYTPPPCDQLDEMIAALCRFVNALHAEGDFIHPVIKAIIIHFWLAYIHPYVDGNGRSSRALFYWYMLSKKYWLFEFVSISRIILHARRQYERAFLHTEYDDCDLNYFIMNQLVAINHALENFKLYLEKKQKELSQSKMILKKNKTLNGRQREILLHAGKNPDYIYTVKTYQNMFNTAYETARRDLMELKRLNFFDLVKSKKEFCFVPVDNLANKLEKK